MCEEKGGMMGGTGVLLLAFLALASCDEHEHTYQVLLSILIMFPSSIIVCVSNAITKETALFTE